MSSSGFKFKNRRTSAGPRTTYEATSGMSPTPGEDLAEAPITIDDPELARELRSWARSITRRNPDRTEAVTSQLARLCVLRGRKQVRADLDATTKREGNPRNQED